MTPTRSNRTTVRAVVAVLAVVVATGGVIWVLAPGGGDDDPVATSTTLTEEQGRQRERANAWMEEVRGAVEDLGAVVPELVEDTNAWLAGDLSGDELASDLDEWRTVAIATREAFADLEEFELAPRANRLLELSGELYVEVVQVHEANLAVDEGDLQTQVHLLARRVRTLADRVFDRGFALVEPFLFREDDPNVTVNLPQEVPIWQELDLAPGPPLAPQPAESSDAPSLREDTRPEQPREDWLAALRLVNPTPAADLAAAIDGGTEDDLRATAERLVAAVESLRGEPDPEDDREASTRVRLGLLIHADAARAAQTARFTSGPRVADELRAVARRLAVIGGDPVLWVDELPSRDPGYDRDQLDRP